MNKIVVVGLIWIALVALFVVTTQAQAKRMGGGKSIGQQNTTVNRQAIAPAKPPAPVAAPAPTARPWGGMLGGLAAGLGLAWLAHSLGFGEEFATVMMVILLGTIALAALVYLVRRRELREEPQPNLNSQQQP